MQAGKQAFLRQGLAPGGPGWAREDHPEPLSARATATQPTVRAGPPTRTHQGPAAGPPHLPPGEGLAVVLLRGAQWLWVWVRSGQPQASVPTLLGTRPHSQFLLSLVDLPSPHVVDVEHQGRVQRPPAHGRAPSAWHCLAPASWASQSLTPPAHWAGPGREMPPPKIHSSTCKAAPLLLEETGKPLLRVHRPPRTALWAVPGSLMGSSRALRADQGSGPPGVRIVWVRRGPAPTCLMSGQHRSASFPELGGKRSAGALWTWPCSAAVCAEAARERGRRRAFQHLLCLVRLC